MTKMTTTTFTAEQEAQIASYIKQGQDRQTAERIVKADARNRKPAARPGTLYTKEFSLFR